MTWTVSWKVFGISPKLISRFLFTRDSVVVMKCLDGSIGSIESSRVSNCFNRKNFDHLLPRPSLGAISSNTVLDRKGFPLAITYICGLT